MIRLHNQNRTHTFIDVESGPFISLPKDETDKPPVNADVNGLMIYGKTIQDGEPTAENPVDPVDIPPEFNLTVCGKNLWVNEALPKTKLGVTLSYDEETDTYTLNGTSRVGDDNLYFTASTYKFYVPIRNGKKYYIKTEIISGTISNSENIRYLTAFVSANFLGNWFTASLLESSTRSKNATEDGFVSNFRIYCSFSGAVTFNDYKFKIHFEESETAPTTIEKYTGNTYPYRLEDLDGNLHELCSLPDGTRDEYDRDNGILIKKVKSIQITDSSVLDYYSLTETIASIYFFDYANKWPNTIWTNTNMRCNIAYPFSSNIANTCFFDKRVDSTLLAIRVNKSELSSQDNAGAQAWAANIISQAGYIEFEYPLATPQIIPIKRYGETYDGQVWDKNQKPKSIQYHTNIFTDVGAEMQCEVRKLGNRKMGEFYWVTENGDYIVTDDNDYIMLEY